MSTLREEPGALATRPPEAASVTRQNALARLKQAADLPLVVVTGPAGYGKTTLLRQYADFRRAAGSALAWVRMESRFTHPGRLLSLLNQAVAELLDGSPAAPEVTDRQSVHVLGERLRQAGIDGVIVLDNYDQTRDPGLETLLTQLIRALPEGVQLCMGARSLSASRLAALKLDSRALVLDEEDLRFEPAETRAFFSEFPELSPAEIDEIHQGSDGWPAALQCFRLCLRRGRKHRSAAYAGRGVTPELLDFLAAEVFENLDAGTRSRLLDLAVPESLDAELTQHLLGIRDGQAYLRELEQSGLFLAAIDLQGRWFRFHNLFRQFLLDRLTVTLPPDELRQRQRRIAEWHAGKGQTDQAIQHFLDAGDANPAAALLNKLVGQMLATERLELIEHYADRLPRDVLLQHDDLTCAAIIAFSFRRAFDKARGLLDDARARYPDSSGPDFAELFLLAAEDRVQALGELAERLLDRFEGDNFRQAICMNARSLWLYACSDFETARDLLVRARSLHDQAGNLFGQAYQEAVHALVLSGQGRIDDALAGLTSALRRTERDTAGNASAGSVLAAYLADGLYEQNRLEAAERLIADYGQFAEQQTIADALAVMLLTQARIARLRGNMRLAEDSIERLVYFGHRHKLGRLVAYGNAELLRYATLDEDLQRAGRRMEMLEDDRSLQPDGSLLFHAGETECVTITRCRWLMASGQYAEARGVLQREIRQAQAQRRHRRALKLLTLLALGQFAQGNQSMAFRTMLRALEIAAPQGFVRSLLDEGPQLTRLLRALREAQPALPAGVQPDPVQQHLDHLLALSGDGPADAASPKPEQTTQAAPLVEQLTRRELDILRQVSRGLSNREMADRLCVSTNTVKWHMRNIFEKLQTRNRVQAIAAARNLGLID